MEEIHNYAQIRTKLMSKQMPLTGLAMKKFRLSEAQLKTSPARGRELCLPNAWPSVLLTYQVGPL